jgi:hypothetical protein
MDICPECGFTYGALPRPQLAPALRASGPALASRLSAAPVDLRRRRADDEWSPLEYACHVRDVSLMQRDRLYVALVEDEPSFKPMYREERVSFDRYQEQDPAEVAEQLTMATALLAHAFAGLTEEQWGRPLMYGFPGPSRRDVEWVAHHTLHEMTHHLADIDRLLGTT